MTSIEIAYELEYLSCELADEHIECKPILTTYFDAHFIRSEAEGGVINTHLDEHDLGKVYEATLKARVPSGTASVPITAAIGFAHYAQRRNEFGMACYTNAGTGHVKMVEILEGLRGNKAFEKRVPLVMETTKLLGEPVKKGEILFRATSVKKGNRVAFLPLDRCVLGSQPPPPGGVDSNSEIISQFIQKRVEFEANMKDTWEGIKNVRAPMDISSAGIELTGTCFVPVEGFALCETLDINEEYFQNAFERSMIRKGFSNPSVGFRSLDLAHRAEVLAEICCYASQSFDYISDTVDLSKREQTKHKGPKLVEAFRSDNYRRIGFEDFHNIGVTASGDCEDSSKCEQVMFHNFRRLSLDANKYPELKELQTISEDYVFFLTLATVHGARVNDGEEKVGAHLLGLMLPKDQVKSCLSTTVEGKVWAERLPLNQKMDMLPTLFCEGTGKIRPLGTGPVALHSFKHPSHGHGLVRSWIGANSAAPSHPLSYDPLFKERIYLGQRMRSRGGLKTEISHDFGAPSNFYLGNLLVITSEFMDVGENLGAFVCGKINHEAGEITRGSDFVELITQQNTVALIPCEPLPDKIMQITREANTIRAPCRSFALDKSKVDPKLKIHPDLERLKSTINGLGRQGEAPFGSVDHFARPHNMNAASINKMIAEIKAMPAVFKVDYEFEHITTSLCQYRIMLFVDKNQI